MAGKAEEKNPPPKTVEKKKRTIIEGKITYLASIKRKAGRERGVAITRQSRETTSRDGTETMEKKEKVAQ